MAEWRKINLNDRVRVKLTDIGVAAYRESLIERHKRLGFPEAPSLLPPLDKEGFYNTHLWPLMRDFGYLMAPGQATPFETEMEVKSK